MEDGARTAPARVDIEGSGEGAWLRVVLHEGRKRQIREVGRRIGLPVRRIIRVRIGTLLLGKLKPGEWRYLSPHEVASLKSESGGEKGPRTPHPRPVGRKVNPLTGSKINPVNASQCWHSPDL